MTKLLTSSSGDCHLKFDTMGLENTSGLAYFSQLKTKQCDGSGDSFVLGKQVFSEANQTN